jgi:hypothetical protein
VDLPFTAKNEDGEIKHLVVGDDPVSKETEGHKRQLASPSTCRTGVGRARTASGVHPDSMAAASRITSWAALPRFTHAA